LRAFEEFEAGNGFPLMLYNFEFLYINFADLEKVLGVYIDPFCIVQQHVAVLRPGWM